MTATTRRQPATSSDFERMREIAALRRMVERMLSEQGIATAIGGGLLCSECKAQQPAAGMLNGAGQCAECAS